MCPKSMGSILSVWTHGPKAHGAGCTQGVSEYTFASLTMWKTVDAPGA